MVVIMVTATLRPDTHPAAWSRIARHTPILAALAISIPAFGEIEFSPSVSLAVHGTDNLALASEGGESQTVYELNPGFGLTQASQRLSSDVDYQLQAYRYSQRSESESYHQLDANTRVALDVENFFLEFGVSRTQSVRDPELAIPVGNLPISANRLDQDEAYAGPAFQYPIGTGATVAGSFRRTRRHYDSDFENLGALPDFRQDSDHDTVSVSVDNHRRTRGFSWSLRYDSQETDYDVGVPWENRRATVELGGWVNDRLRFFSAGGKESAWDQPFDPSLEDNFWEVGVAHSAGENFSAEFAAGERSFGSSRRGNLQMQLHRVNWQVRYAETPTTLNNDPYLSVALAEFLIDDLLSRPGTSERYISNRLEWILDFDFDRISFGFSTVDESREQRVAIDGSALSDEKQSSAELHGRWQAGVRTSFSIGAADNDLEFGDGAKRQLRRANISAEYDLGPRTDLSLILSRFRDEPIDRREGDYFPYRADLISLRLTRTF